MGKLIDLTGQRFGQLIVLGRSNKKTKRTSGSALWDCECLCPERNKVVRSSWELRNGKAISCGCYSQPTDLRRKLYTAWQNIKSRCLNPKHPAYKSNGGRGIKMYESWIDDFELFAQHFSEPASPDYVVARKNQDGDFAPGNMCWAPPTYPSVYGRNTGLYYDTEVKDQVPLSVLTKRYGGDIRLVRRRLRSNWRNKSRCWSTYEAITTPVRHRAKVRCKLLPGVTVSLYALIEENAYGVDFTEFKPAYKKRKLKKKVSNTADS